MPHGQPTPSTLATAETAVSAAAYLLNTAMAQARVAGLQVTVQVDSTDLRDGRVVQSPAVVVHLGLPS